MTSITALQFNRYNNPILLLNDAPDGLGGLARIGRDLASLLCTMPEFRVGYLGRGGIGRVQFPWMQYSYPESAQWGEEHLADVWHDFSRNQDGIIMSLWDVSRMTWFGDDTQGLPSAMRVFLGPGRSFLKWGYFPVDSWGPRGQPYGGEMGSALKGYDRVLAPSAWGAGVLLHHNPTANWIPHGIWMNHFRPNERDDDQPGYRMLGCNMANQARKDWPIAFKAAGLLRQVLGNRFHLWAHTDRPIHYWNLYALAQDFGLDGAVEITTQLTDNQLAYRYSCCEATILPSAGEGFGFPIAESMACGTPCVVTDYGAGQEIVDPDCRVKPVAYRIDTQYNLQRAVLDENAFAEVTLAQMNRKHDDPTGTSQVMVNRVAHLDWNKLAFVWKKWLLEGLHNA